MKGYIVEGKNDVKKVQQVLENCYFVVLNGVRFHHAERLEIKKALSICEEVYILTDPDEAGDNVAEKISYEFPEIKRILIDPNKAKTLKRRGYKYGVEYCSNRYLRERLMTVTFKEEQEK